MHFAIVAPPLAGHYNPLAALALELVGRGHRATFVHQRDAAPLALRHGVDFHALPGQLGEHRGVGGTVREMVRQLELLCREAPPALRALGVDAILADQLAPAGGLIAELLDLPYVTIACALPVNREPNVPPPYVGWRYDSSRRGRRWNEGGWKISDWLMRPLGDSIARQSAAWGLRPRRRLDDCFSPTLQLAQAVPAIDFPRVALPASFHYLGPLRRADAAVLPGLPERPFVYCTLGTLQGARAGLFEQVAGACVDLGLPLVLTHGGLLPASAVARLPSGVLAFDYLPQEAVLERALLAVTHGGFNTVLDCLARGKPMVAMPIAFEQPGIAARIRYAGVGEIVAPRRASRRRLAGAIAQVLDDGAYRAAAITVAKDIGRAGGVVRAADLIEEALRCAVAPTPAAAATTAAAARDDARDDSRSGSN